MSSRKILMLHGFVQNGAVFRAKTGGLRKALAKMGYETYYPTAPTRIEPADLPFDDISQFDAGSDSDYRGWWVRGDGQYDFDGVLEFMKQEVVQHGPFEGIIGFSQGGALAGVLASEKLREIIPTLKWSINVSGYKVDPEKYQHLFPIELPMLHVIGELDTVVEESRVMALHDANTNATLLRHAGGHYVPNSKPFVAKLCNWIAAHAAPEKAEQKEETTEDLLKMMDGFGSA